MDKKEINKNRLDLTYNKYLCILNGLFLILTSGAFGIISSIIFLEDKNKKLFGLSISAVILMIIYISIKKVNQRIEEVLEYIDDI